MARHLQATGTWSPTEHAPSVLLNRLLVNVKLPVMLLLLPGLTFGRAVIVRSPGHEGAALQVWRTCRRGRGIGLWAVYGVA